MAIYTSGYQFNAPISQQRTIIMNPVYIADYHTSILSTISYGVTTFTVKLRRLFLFL